jgi:hypothetical protein
MHLLRPKSVDERLSRQVEVQKLRRLRIENDLRELFGYGVMYSLFFIILAIVVIVVLSGCGVLAFRSPTIFIIGTPLVAFLGIVCAIARRLFNPEK